MAERFGQDLLLLERLAAGGMAEVYRAKQTGYGGFEKTVAVKRILPNYASDEEFKGMFRQEANLSACLQHQSIVQVFGNGEHDGYLYLVMEFVDGKNVRQLLSRCERRKKRIPIELSLFIVAETAKGLHYAHNYCDEKSGQPLNIVHRDMSPQNIMVGYDASVKIVDFGIAKAASWADNTRAGVLKGKFGYMSPEQARGERLDHRTDIFALGIILFETLTQRRLFTSEDDLRTIKMVKECNVPRPSKYNPAVSSQLDRIVLKSLEKNKADRYQSAQELYEDIIVYLNQKYPKFVPTELSRFLKDLFREDIEEDKKKREKQAAEAPAIIAQPDTHKAPKNKKNAPTNDKDKTDIGDLDEEKTQLSQSNIEAKELVRPLPEGLEIKATDDEDKSSSPAFHVPSPAVELSFTGSGIKPEPADFQKPLIFEKALPGKAAHPPIPRLEKSTNVDVSGLNSYKMDIPVRNVVSQKARKFRIYLGAVAVLAIAFYISQDPEFNSSSAPESKIITENKVEATPEPSPHLVDKVEKVLPVTPSPALDRPPASVPSTVTLREIQGSHGPYGRIRLNTIPRADEFYVNDKLVVDENGEPFKVEGQDFLMPPGEFKIHLKNKGFEKEWTGTLTVMPDVRQQKDIVFK